MMVTLQQKTMRDQPMLEYIKINPHVATTARSIPISRTASANVVTPMRSVYTMKTIALPWQTAEEIEEEEWKALVAQPEIQRGFSRLADKIRADIAAGKFEEGGFAVE